MADQNLTAKYTAPGKEKHFSLKLPTLPEGQNVDEKTAYLESLRTNITSLQGEVNVFLTQRMEEDKATESNNKTRAQESKEEEMYGEEDVEADA